MFNEYDMEKISSPRDDNKYVSDLLGGTVLESEEGRAGLDHRVILASLYPRDWQSVGDLVDRDGAAVWRPQVDALGSPQLDLKFTLNVFLLKFILLWP